MNEKGIIDRGDSDVLSERHPLSEDFWVISKAGCPIEIWSRGELVLALTPPEGDQDPWLPGAIQRAVDHAKLAP